MTNPARRLPPLRRSLALLLLAALTAGPGCAVKRTTTIHGTVTYKGAPVSVGAIYFHGPDNRMAMGNLDEDGTFTATDVPLGEVRVSLQVRDPGAYAQQMKDPRNRPAANPKGGAHAGVTSVPEKYADPNTSGLKYPIDARTQELDVKLE
jgi:hypothetical protein